jgi:23S rRNA U2552 (ribose-2'-O)-methylase RlmE/FtsJ
VSDISHNLIGNAAADALRHFVLVSDALSLARSLLSHRGSFVAKVRLGGDERRLVEACQTCFRRVTMAKPRASRTESAEVYIVCQGFMRV